MKLSVLRLPACRPVHGARPPWWAAMTMSGSSRAGRRGRVARPQDQSPHDYVRPQAFRTPILEELDPTSDIADNSCEWLDRDAAGIRDQTVFLTHRSRPAPSVHAAWPLFVDDRPRTWCCRRSFDHGNRPLARAPAWSMEQRQRGTAVVSEQAASAVDERERARRWH